MGRFMVLFGSTSLIFESPPKLCCGLYSEPNTPEEQTLFLFGWFIVGLLTQTLIVHMVCTPKIPFIQSRAAPPLLVMTAVIMGFGIFLPMGPLAHYFKLQARPPLYFMFLPLILLAYMALTQARNGIDVRRYGWHWVVCTGKAWPRY